MLFPAWETFYVIVGSSGAALTSIMFVVIALVADFRSSAKQMDAFGTPTIVHFCAVLMLSAILTAPWPGTTGLRGALGLFGAAGVIYQVLVLRRTQHQDGYEMVFEDWLFHTILPFASYGGILIAAIVLPQRPVVVLFAIAAAAMTLLFTGIHNSWDTVTYIIVARWDKFSKDRKELASTKTETETDD